MNDWEIAKVIVELEKINQLKMDDHTSLQQALVDIYEAPWEDQMTQRSATTGIKKLGEFTGGFQNGEVRILAARPSMGKTDVMLHFAKMSGWAGFLPLVFLRNASKADHLPKCTGCYVRKDDIIVYMFRIIKGGSFK
jgi:replicative DNA helicase